jgi:hypothetical protein
LIILSLPLFTLTLTLTLPSHVPSLLQIKKLLELQLLSILKKHISEEVYTSSPALQKECYWPLRSLSFDPQGVILLKDEGFLPPLFSLMSRYLDNSLLQTRYCFVLANLSSELEVYESLIQLRVWNYCKQLLSLHQGNALVLRECCSAVWGITGHTTERFSEKKTNNKGKEKVDEEEEEEEEEEWDSDSDSDGDRDLDSDSRRKFVNRFNRYIGMCATQQEECEDEGGEEEDEEEEEEEDPDRKLKEEVLLLILKGTKLHPEDIPLHKEAAGALCNIFSELKRTVYEGEVIKYSLETMKIFSEEVKLQECNLLTLINICSGNSHEVNRKKTTEFIRIGLLSSLKELLERFPNEGGLHSKVLKLLSIIASEEEVTGDEGEDGGVQGIQEMVSLIPTIYMSLRTHLHRLEIQKKAWLLLQSFAFHEEVAIVILSKELAERIKDTISVHQEELKVQRNVWGALRNILSTSWPVVQPPPLILDEILVDFIIHSLRTYPTHAQLIEHLIHLLGSLTRDSERNADFVEKQRERCETLIGKQRNHSPSLCFLL